MSDEFKNKNQISDSNFKQHSKLSILSYSLGDFIFQIFAITFGAYVFYYYEVELGLNSWLTMIGFIIYAIWNAVNDPLVGYLCDRPYFFTKKWGRRFPWIISSIFPSILCYILLYSPPIVNHAVNQIGLFLWLIFATCLFDTALSFWGVNIAALYPDKFRSPKERRTVSGYKMLLSYLGIAVGSILPPFIVNYGVKQSFIDQAWVLLFITLIAAIFAIPGMRDDKEMVNQYLENYETRKSEKEPLKFFKIFFQALKQKNFVV